MVICGKWRSIQTCHRSASKVSLDDFNDGMAPPNAKVADGEQFKENQASGIKSALNVLYVLLAGWLNLVKGVAVLACVLVVLALRLLSRQFGWKSPTPTDLTPVVAAVPKRAARTGGRAVSRIGDSLGVKVAKRSTRQDHPDEPPTDVTERSPDGEANPDE